MTGLERIVERLRARELSANNMPAGMPRQKALDDCHNMRLLVEFASEATAVVHDEGGGFTPCSDPACSMCRLTRAVHKMMREGE
jgi:hypothetical protein